MGDSEAAAIEQASRGDREAFRVLVEQHSRTVFRLAYRMTGDQQDAEDTVQGTFLRAYRQIRRFDARSKFSTWICRIAVNCSLDLLRARRRRCDSEDLIIPDGAAGDQPSPERLAFSRQVQRKVAATLAGLSPAERAAFVLRHFEGLSAGEIARLLGHSNGATRHSIFRAVRKLRRAAIQSLGMAGKKYSDALVAIYSSDSDKAIRKAVQEALFVQSNDKALIEIARKETDPELKKHAVEMLSVMGSKEAKDFMLEILNK